MPHSCRIWPVQAASEDCLPGYSRTRRPFAGPHPWLRSCACVDTPRAASRCRCDGRASSIPPAALRALASLSARVSLIRFWSPVSPPSFPRTLPCSGAPFPPRGPSGWFPRFFGPVKHSDFLPPLPRYFVSFASRYRRHALGFAPAGARRSTHGPGVIHRIPQPGSSTETTGPPRFLEDPTMNVPCSPTPVGPLRSATAALRFCLPPFGRRRLPRLPNISRLNHTARTFAVYASQGGLPHRHARLASGWLATNHESPRTTKLYDRTREELSLDEIERVKI